MAEEIAYKVSVDTGQGGKSLKDLKNDFKNAQSELSGLEQGTKAYIKQLEKLGAIRDNIGDLNAEINAFNPEGKVKAFGNVIGGMASGFAAAQGAAALFGGQSEQVEKTLLKVQAAMAFSEGIKGVMGLADGFKVLGNVIRANPLMLIATIIIGIGTALFALKDKISFVGDAFDFVGEIIGDLVQGFKDLTDWIGLTSNASDELAETQIANAKKTGDAISDRYDREIERATAAGKNTVDLEREKQKAIIETLKLEAIAIVQAAKARGEFTEEENTRFTELIALTQKASDEIVIINIKENKKKEDENKALTKKGKAELKTREEEEKAHLAHLKEINELWLQSHFDAGRAAYDANIEQNKINKEQEAIDLNAMAAEYREADSEDAIATAAYTYDAVSGLNSQEVNERLELAQASNNSLMELSNLLFEVKRGNMVKGSAQELKLAKRQFAINKALAITNTVISTVQGMIKAIANNPPPSPIGIIGAALTGVAGTIATAKIATTKFMGGGGDGGGGGGSAGTIAIPAPPTIAPPSQGNTDLNPDGTIKNKSTSQSTIKAYVVETDVTKTQKTVKQIEDKAKL